MALIKALIEDVDKCAHLIFLLPLRCSWVKENKTDTSASYYDRSTLEMEKKVGKMLRQKSFARNWGEPGEFENLDCQIMDDSFERWVRSIFSCSENVFFFFQILRDLCFMGINMIKAY